MVVSLLRRFSRFRGAPSGGGQSILSARVSNPAGEQVVIDALGRECVCEVGVGASPSRCGASAEATPQAGEGELTCFVLQESLKEKELLIREIHHRVKNNLQVISSLLSLQGRSSTSPDAQRACAESQHRIKSIALIHELLYQSENMSRISASEYVQRLGTKLISGFGVGSRVSLHCPRSDVSIDLDHAVPFGLVVNELFTNSMKHAFPGERRGTIAVEFRRDTAGRVVLDFKDDGIGIPAAIEPLRSESLGFRLIGSLAQQLDGVLQFQREAGVHFTITFPMKEFSGE